MTEGVCPMGLIWCFTLIAKLSNLIKFRIERLVTVSNVTTKASVLEDGKTHA